MDISSSHEHKDRISELPDDILFECLSLLEMKNSAQTSILSTRWRYLWAHFTNLDFDPKEEFDTFWDNHKYQTRKYFAWVNQVVRAHRGPSIDKFRVHVRYVSSYATQLDKWVEFALSSRVKELVLDLIGINLMCGDHSRKGHPLGFDILRHPLCYSGITSLRSLHLQYVNIRGEFVEFLLSHCLNLERLYLHSTPLSTLKANSSKLKYLTIIMRFHDLEELEIDADNLLYLEYNDARREGGPRMVFKNLPKLVEINFRSGFCRFPFPIFQQLSLFSMQLCKLSLNIDFDTMIPHAKLVIPDGVIPTFPNVKHFTCTTLCFQISCITSMKRFIEACPMLEKFKLQVTYMLPQSSTEASELQEILLEDDESADLGNINQAPKIKLIDEKQGHHSLRILELVGFLGTRCDVELALAVVSYACSLTTIVCDPRGVRYGGNPESFFSEALDEYDFAKRRARKLAKIVAPRIQVVII